MIRNDIMTRPNENITVTDARNLTIAPLTTTPFGVQNALDLVERDEFVIMLSKAAFGPIESRPVLFDVDAWRYARAVVWWRVYRLVDGVWVFSHYENREERHPSLGLPRARAGYPGGPGSGQFMEVSTPRNRHNNFTHQRVSGLQTNRWTGVWEWCAPLPEQGDNGQCIPDPMLQVRAVEWRGEFVTNPEHHTNPIFHTNTRDYWTYVSANVWELYLYELISRGILDQNELFILSPRVSVADRPLPLIHTGLATDDFRLEQAVTGFAEEFERLVEYWGRTRDGAFEFPVMAPELGVVMPNNPENSTSVNIRALGVTGEGQAQFADVLGRNYLVEGSTITWRLSDRDHRATMGLPLSNLFSNDNMTVISALRLIERVLRITDHNMSELEASIIAHRYGARFLDDIDPRDVSTVEYLIAMGIIDFERFEEFTNLYSMLSREFAFVLLGRLANPASRTHFSQILLTDAAGFSTFGERNYQTSVQSSMEIISRFVDGEGNIRHNPTEREAQFISAGGANHLAVERVDEFSLMSDVFIASIHEAQGIDAHGSHAFGAFRIILDIDDPLKYLYDDMPLVLTSHNHRLSPGFEGGRNFSPGYPLYVVTDHRILDWRNGAIFGDPEFIQLRPFPENRIRGQHPEWLADLEDIHDWMNFTNGIADQIFHQYPIVQSVSEGILGVAAMPNGRYLVEIAIASPTADVASTFVLNRLSNRTMGLFNEDNVSGLITAGGQPLVQDGTQLTADISTFGDVSRRSETPIIMSNTASISGGHITAGSFDVTGESGAYVPFTFATNGGTNAAHDHIGNQPLVVVDHTLLNAPNSTLMAPDGSQPIRLRQFGDSQFINVSTSNLHEFFTSEFRFNRTMTVHAGSGGISPEDANLGPIYGYIFMELVPYLPSRQEQAYILEHNIDPSSDDWMFTEPENDILRQYWDFNKPITQAIVTTLGLSGDFIPSGYFTPNIYILIPELESTVDMSDDFMNQFLEAVGTNLDHGWINRWVDTQFRGTFNTPGGSSTDELDFVAVRDDIPLWAEIYFFNRRPTVAVTLLETRLEEPQIDVHRINHHLGPHRVFGPTERIDGDGDVPEYVFSARFVMNGFNHVYVNQNLTRFLYHNGRLINTIGLQPSRVGQLITVAGNEFLVVDQTETDIMLVANSVIEGHITQGGEMVANDGGMPLTEAAQQWTTRLLEGVSNNTANTNLTFNFLPFNTFHTDLRFRTANEIFIERGEARLFRVLVGDEGVVHRVPAQPIGGNAVVLRPFVRLSASEWYIPAGVNSLVWSPSLNTNVGATTLTRLVNRFQDTLLDSNSENRVMVSDLRQATVDIGGGSVLFADNNGIVSLRVPMRDEFINDVGQLDVDAVHTFLDITGNLAEVITTGNSYPISAFLQVGDVMVHVPESPRYTANVLTRVNNNLYVTSPDSHTLWTRYSALDYIDLELAAFTDFSVVNLVRDLGGEVISRADSFQSAAPLRPPVGLRSYEFGAALMNVLGTLTPGVQAFEGVSHAYEFFNQLVVNFALMRTRSFLSLMVWSAITLSMFFAVFLLVVRVNHDIPWTRNLVDALYNNTSIDLFAIGSLGIIRVDEKPRSWIEIVFFSIGIGIVPLAIVLIFHLFGFVVL